MSAPSLPLRPVSIEVSPMRLPRIDVMPGEYTTIWLHGSGPDNLHQVEAHVAADGTPRILVKRDSEIVAPFEDVYP